MAPEEKRRGGKQRLVHGKSPASKLPSENHETQDCPGLLPPSPALPRHPVRLSPATAGPLLCCCCRVECFSFSRTLPQLSDFSEGPLDPHPPQVAPGAPHPLPRLFAGMLAPHQPAGSLSVQLWERPSVRQTGAWGPSTVLGGAGGTVSSIALRVVLSCNGRSEQAVAGSWWRGQAAPQRGSRARGGFLGSRGRGRQQGSCCHRKEGGQVGVVAGSLRFVSRKAEGAFHIQWRQFYFLSPLGLCPVPDAKHQKSLSSPSLPPTAPVWVHLLPCTPRHSHTG